MLRNKIITLSPRGADISGMFWSSDTLFACSKVLLLFEDPVSNSFSLPFSDLLLLPVRVLSCLSTL